MFTPRSCVSCRIAASSFASLSFFGLASTASAQIKIACVGDSITAGGTYQSTLQSMLNATYGTGAYQVLNFGVSGTTATRTGSNASDYTATQKFLDAQAAAPDIVTILLGTNDSRCADMPTRLAPDYLRIVDTFLSLPKVPKIYAMDSSFMPNDGHWSDNDPALVAGVIPRIHEVTRLRNLPSVDLHTPTFGHVEWVPDNVHPAGDAGPVMAASIFRAITGRRAPEHLYAAANFIPTNNSLTNGDIEAGTTGWTPNGGGTLSINAATTHGGAKALQISGRTAGTQGPSLDVTNILQANGQGDYFFEAWARVASIAAGSPNATLTLTLTAGSSPTSQTFSTVAGPISTTTWTDLRTTRKITWNGSLVSARLSIATNSGCLDPLLVDDCVLEFRGLYSATNPKGYPNSPGQVVEPTYLVGSAISSSQIDLGWTDNSNAWTPVEAGNALANTINETGFTIERATNVEFTRDLSSSTAPANTTALPVTGLNAGTTYYFRVRADGSAGGTVWTNSSAVTTQGAAAGPAAPTGFAVTAVADTTVALTWTDAATNETGYRVEWASDPNMVHVSESAALPAGATSYTVTGLLPSSTYAFRVRALGNPSDSASSNAIQKITYRARPNGTALNLAATVATSTQANLTWVDNCTNESGWVAEWATNAAFTQSFGSSPVGNGAIAKNAFTYSATGLIAGSTYYFRVRPYNAIGDGDNKTTPQYIYGTYSDVPVQALPPNPPGGLSALVSSASQANLSWADNSSNETGFIVDRATDGGFTQNVMTANLAANTTAYNAAGLAPNTAFYFRVRAVNAGGESVNSSAASVTTPNAGTPSTPAGLGATTISKNQIDLAWTDNSGDETGFAIDRATDSAFTLNVATTTASTNAVTASITGLGPLTTYYFRVRATNAAGASVNSSSANSTTLPLPPAAPTSLLVSSITEARVSLTWTDNSTTETGFRIDRATDAAFTQNVLTGSVGAGVLTYTATGLTENTTYYFRVKSFNSGGNSSDSNTVNATTPAPTIPAAPNGTTGTAVSESQINLSWIDSSLNETGFKRDRASNAAFTQNLTTVTVPADTTASNVTGLATATTYYFRLRAINAAGESVNSNTVTVATLSNVLAASDPFAPSLGSLNAAAGGSGWTTAWTADAATYNVAAGSLTYSDSNGATLTTSGNRVAFVASATYRQANRGTGIFASKMSGGGPLDIWFSCLLKPSGGSRDFNPWSKDPYNTGALAQGSTSLTYYNTGWLGGGTETKSAPSVTLQANQVNLIICRYEVAADKHSLKWTWYVNPSDLSNPASSATQVIWTASNPTGTLKGLDGFGIRSRTDTNTAFDLDEIRYGDSVQLVTPYLSTPATPTGLTAVHVSTSQINLSWADNASNETAFGIDRATDAAFTQNFTTQTIAANSTSHSAAGLAANTTFYFRLRATNAAGDSANSNTANATTATGTLAPGAAASPSPINGATGGTVNPTLIWTAGSGAVTHNIYFGTTTPPAFHSSQSGTSFAPATLANNTTYFWSVEEVNAGGTTPGPVWSFRTTPLQDSVGDGIPDVWRASHFGGSGTTADNLSSADRDPDGDGWDNGKEFTAGTDPNNPTDAFRLNITASGGALTISFATIPAGEMEAGYDRCYAVDAVNLETGAVTEVAQWVGAGQAVTCPVPNAGDRAFYRGRVWLRLKP